MNETEFAILGGYDTHRLRLPINFTDRLFFTCTLLGAAILLSTLTGIREIENISGSTKATLLALQSQPMPDMFMSAGPLQLQPILPVGLADNGDWDVTGNGYARSRPDPWEKFETEFGIAQPERSLVAQSIQMAEYNMDRLRFTANEMVRNLSSVTQFELDNGRISRVSTARLRLLDDPYGPSKYIPEKFSVGLDVNMTHGGPYLGIAFVVPLGD